jgi:hypothetical protein
VNRKINVDTGAFSPSGLDFGGGTVLAEDTHDGGHAESMSVILGAVEWIENAYDGGVVHAVPGV